MAVPFLLVYGGGDEGGAVEYLLHLIDNLNRAEFAPVFVSLGRDSLRPDVERRGVAYHVAQSPLAVARLARSADARFLHTHGVRANFAGRLAGLLTGLPSVTTVHSMIAMDYMSARMRLAATVMDNLTLSLSRRIIAVSRAIASDVIKRGARVDRVRVVYNGIPPAPHADRAMLRASLGVDPAAFTLVTVGRLHPVKGIGYLLEALVSLPEARLFVIGDGPERAALEARAFSLGIGERVSFLGHVNQARQLLGAFDAYVSPSVMEGLGLAVMEAMAAGLPVVATGVGGVLELLEDGRTGLLVPPGDSGALASATRRLMSDQALAERLGQAGQRHYLETFTVEQFVRRTESVYRETIGGTGGLRT